MVSLSYSLTQLHYFVTAAHTLNLTHAARECHVSQPSISGAVHHLEEVFQTQLFLRDPSRGLSLTPSGKQLLELAEALLDQARTIAEDGSGDYIVGTRSGASRDRLMAARDLIR